MGKRFGDDACAAEELVTEMGAALLCADLGISALPGAALRRLPRALLQVLRADSRAIFAAATQAQRAANDLHSLQPQADAVET